MGESDRIEPGYYVSMEPDIPGGARRMLAVYAHPDDEVFTAGGTMALQARRGTHVTIAIATGGEEGEVVNPELQGVVSLDALPLRRQQELACSAGTLGAALVRLGYRDSGMAGTPSSREPEAFSNQDRDEVARRLVGIMRDLRPHVVCTEAEDGGYGHPDHIMVHYVTQLAFERAGDSAWYPDLGVPWQPLKLYYGTWAQEMTRRLKAGFARHGIPFEFGTGLDDVDNEDVPGRPAEALTTIVDISGTVETKIKAMHCHETQIKPNFFYFTAPHDVVMDALSREYFILGESKVQTELPESDVFAGVAL
ncbi:MAG TPA: PIG-L family deacetylase [Chloroflexota bacterium]